MKAVCDWCEETKEIAIKATATDGEGIVLHQVRLCADCVKSEMKRLGALSSTIRVGFDIGTEWMTGKETRF